MKPLSKLLGIIVLGLLVALAGAIFTLTHLIDPNDYKDEIRSLVRERTGYDLQVEGEIGWSLFPWLGLELTDTRLARMDKSDQPFASVRMLGFSVRALPLLRREIRMSDIRIDGLDLQLVRDDRGNNWEAPPATDIVIPQENTPAPSSTPEMAKLNLEIDSLIVNSARLDWRDETSGQQLTLESVQISSGAIGERKDIPLKLSGFLASNAPLLRARLEMSASAWLDHETDNYRLDGLKLTGEMAGEPFNNKSLNFSLQGNLQLDQASKHLSWQQIKFTLNQLKGIGELQLTSWPDTPELTGKLSVAAFDAGSFLKGLGMELPAMADKSALNHLELTANLRGGQNHLLLDNTRLQLDGSSLQGTLGWSELDTQRLRIQLTGDRLNMDRYLPPSRSTPAVRPTGSATSDLAGEDLPAILQTNPWSDEQLLPLDLLAGLNLDLALDLDHLTLHKLPLENSRIRFDARNGKLQLKQFDVRLYGGSLALNAELDSKANPAQLRLAATTEQLPLHQLLKTLGSESPVQGKLQLDSQLTTSGNSQRQWVAGLTGHTEFSLLDGTLPDSNLEQQLCMAIATLNRKQPSNLPGRRSPAFSRLQGNNTISRGIAHSNDLDIALAGLHINGTGDLDINLMALDYRLGIAIKGDIRPMPDPACTVNPRYNNLEWPLRCRGPLANASQSCRVDRDGLGRVASQLAGERLTEKIEEKLNDKISPDLKDALKGLFRK